MGALHKAFILQVLFCVDTINLPLGKPSGASSPAAYSSELIYINCYEKKKKKLKPHKKKSPKHTKPPE